jgi:alpha-L-rhamnosidase
VCVSGPRTLRVLLSVGTSDGNRLYFGSAVPGGQPSSASAVPIPFTATQGPVVADDIYNGETYDATLYQPGWSTCGFSGVWPNATSVPSQPNAVLSWHTVPITVDDVYSPVAITQPATAPGDFVIDFGQNMAGQTTTNVVCPNGPQSITYLYGESLHPDGTVLNQYGNIMRANFTCAGTGDVESYTTLFSYYGFRYVQVTNWPGVPDESSFSAQFTHSAVEPTGAFNTNNELLNNIQVCRHGRVWVAVFG